MSKFNTSLKQRLAFYGFTTCPLSDDRIEALEAAGFSVDQSYGAACDVAAGFTFVDAVSAAHQEAASQKVRADVTLSTGAVITHSRMPNGAQEATVEGRDNGAMTESEWFEYCDFVRANPLHLQPTN